MPNHLAASADRDVLRVYGALFVCLPVSRCLHFLRYCAPRTRSILSRKYLPRATEIPDRRTCANPCIHSRIEIYVLTVYFSLKSFPTSEESKWIC